MKTHESTRKSQKAPSPVIADMACSPEAINPDLDQAEFFLNLLGPGEDYTFQTFSDVKSGYDPLAKVYHGTLSDHATTLTDINRKGGGVFVMINEGDGKVRPGSKTCRKAENIIRVRALCVDLDGSPIEPVLASDPAPLIVVESSLKHYHAYWLVRDVALAEFKPLQQRLALKFDGDTAVCDLPRVLRLPGFFHNKKEPFMSRVIKPTRELQ